MKRQTSGCVARVVVEGWDQNSVAVEDVKPIRSDVVGPARNRHYLSNWSSKKGKRIIQLINWLIDFPSSPSAFEWHLINFTSNRFSFFGISLFCWVHPSSSLTENVNFIFKFINSVNISPISHFSDGIRKPNTINNFEKTIFRQSAGLICPKLFNYFLISWIN